jgi:hypothetical protein
METGKLGSWLHVGANVGILAGLILVAVQINQTSALVSEQLENSNWTDQLNLHLAMMGENPAAAVAKAIENPSDLTVEETRVLDAYLAYWALSEVREINLYKRGMSVYPPSTYGPDDRAITLHKRMLGNAYFKARFDASGLGPDLTPKLAGLMESLSGREAFAEYENIVGRIRTAD